MSFYGPPQPALPGYLPHPHPHPPPPLPPSLFPPPPPPNFPPPLPRPLPPHNLPPPLPRIPPPPQHCPAPPLPPLHTPSIPRAPPPLPPPLPPSQPPLPPPPLPLPPPPPTRSPDGGNSQFPRPLLGGRGPEFAQFRHKRPEIPPLMPSSTEQALPIPPLFPTKEIHSPPRPPILNFPPQNEPRRENFPDEPRPLFNPERERQTRPENPPQWNDNRGNYFAPSPNRNPVGLPPPRGPPPREQWREMSPPHNAHNEPLRGPPGENFTHENSFRDDPRYPEGFVEHRDCRFHEGPSGSPGTNFLPQHPEFRPPGPGDGFEREPRDLNFGPRGIRQGDFRPPYTDEPQRSPTREFFHDENPPGNFRPRSPEFERRPPDFDRPPEFRRPPEFERPPDFERPQEFDRPPDFERPQEFERPPDFERPQEFDRPPDFERPPEFHRMHNGGTFRRSPPAFHLDEPCRGGKLSVDTERWFGEREEGDRFSPRPHRRDFHDPPDHPRKLPLLPTPLVCEPEFPKPEIKTVTAEKIFDPPGRNKRPSHIVIILRGLPGAGKSHVAKVIREKEISHGAPAPRLLSLDSYFLTEVEKMEKDPDTGRRVKRKVQEYEYEAEMEAAYRASLFKTYNKTLEEGYFPMIVVDATNNKVHHFDRYWSNGKMKGFEVYVVELVDSIDICVARNIHQRSRPEIQKLAREWEETPPHFTRLDVTALTSDSNIDEVEMECTESDSEGESVKQEKKSEAQSQPQQVTNQNQDGVANSRWEDASDERLDKLDAVGAFLKRKRLHSELEEEEDDEELSLLEYLRRRDERPSRAGSSGKKKKQVRWADLEAKKEEERRREVGFCIGGSWGQVSEEEARAILTGVKTSAVNDESQH